MKHIQYSTIYQTYTQLFVLGEFTQVSMNGNKGREQTLHMMLLRV